jgi:hypothetical protein
MKALKALTYVTVVLLGPLIYAAQATDISGTISSSLTISNNSQLVGAVTCAVPLTTPGSKILHFDRISPVQQRRGG